MNGTPRVHTVAQLVTAVHDITAEHGVRLWWRGQGLEQWELVPHVYRDGLAVKEQNLLNRFKLMAGTRHSRCPEPNDAVAWLLLAQHYGLPTRLLDWSESPLVAAYFAVHNRDHDSQDGALWALRAPKLNQVQGASGGMLGPYTGDLRPIFVRAFDKNKPEDSRILAVAADQRDPRHMVQQSAFTLHGSHTPINQLPSARTFLAKLLIAGEAKAQVYEELTNLGIDRSWLFPDLTNLAAYLMGITFSALEPLEIPPDS